MTLTPIATGDGACGVPSGAGSIRITAFARSGTTTQALSQMETVAIDSFPADTEQIGVEVAVGNGVIGAQGKTPPIDFNGLDDGATIKLFMAPPNGYCPTLKPMTEARLSPLVALTGGGVLIVGGQGAAGEWLTTAEYYDPLQSDFTPVTVPETFTLDNQLGFAGASLITLPDGRAALTGGPISGLTIFDPATMKFSAPELIEPRAFHGALAVDADHILLAGGCASIDQGMCGTERVSTRTYTVDNTLISALGPTLQAARIGASLFDLGIDDNGAHAYLMAGGTPRATIASDLADRFTLAAPGAQVQDATAVSVTHAQAVQLDGGSVLSTYAPDGTTDGTGMPAPSGQSSTIGSSGLVATTSALGPARDGARLVTLEDGRVLSVGGADDNSVLLYDPTRDRWDSVDITGEGPSPSFTTPDSAEHPRGRLDRPTMIRLGDGSVLVLGGVVHALRTPPEALATSDAWIFRPSLVGPASGSTTVLPGSSTSAALTPIDPSTMARTPELAIAGSGVPARALVGGPRRASGSVQANVRVLGGGVALIAQQLPSGSALFGELLPGSTARIVRREGGQTHVNCSGSKVPTFDPEVPVTIRLEVSSGSARLLLNGDVLATCDLDRSDRGAWGLAALVSSQVVIGSVTVDH
ncbi:MAG TPA: hypothetical protein VGM90_02845 [Kofleriaceae bacterium]